MMRASKIILKLTFDARIIINAFEDNKGINLAGREKV